VLRRVATVATDAACRVVGRRQVVRAARFALMRARLDVPNDRTTNGEALLASSAVGLTSPGHAFHVVDAGANAGQWARLMLGAARLAGRMDDLDLHSFEPSSYTFARLSEALDGQHVTLKQAALGACAGSATLHVFVPGAGINSLHRMPGWPDGGVTEQVPLTTLEAYADEAGLDHITLLKIDTEGHDLAVLRGAGRLFADQRISIAQFEYNHRWVYARFFLRDAFELLTPMGYRIGKLTPFGVEFYPAWDAELETFVEGNYIVCTKQAAERLPTVRWWKLAERDPG
jgi:FkbM family methyltransferase